MVLCNWVYCALTRWENFGLDQTMAGTKHVIARKIDLKQPLAAGEPGTQAQRFDQRHTRKMKVDIARAGCWRQYGCYLLKNYIRMLWWILCNQQGRGYSTNSLFAAQALTLKHGRGENCTSRSLSTHRIDKP